MTDPQAILRDLARVKVIFQLRTIAAIINGPVGVTPLPAPPKGPSHG